MVCFVPFSFFPHLFLRCKHLNKRRGKLFCGCILMWKCTDDAVIHTTLSSQDIEGSEAKLKANTGTWTSSADESTLTGFDYRKKRFIFLNSETSQVILGTLDFARPINLLLLSVLCLNKKLWKESFPKR